MKNFITTNKYTIVFILVVLLDMVMGLQNMADIPKYWQLPIKVLGLFATILLNKVQHVNDVISDVDTYTNNKYSRVMSKKKLTDYRFTIWDQLKMLLIDFKEGFTYKNLFIGQGPINMLIGLGFLLMLSPILDINKNILHDLSIYLFCSILAFSFGMLIEMIQYTYFATEYDENDVTSVTWGYLLFIPIAMFLVSKFNVNLIAFSGLCIFILALYLSWNRYIKD